ncbi:PAS domain-containing protein [Pseudomonadota bacterium]
MQIRTLIALGGGTSIVVVAAAAVAMYFAYMDISDAYRRSLNARDIGAASSNLSILTGEYLLYRGKRAEGQWLGIHESLDRMLLSYAKDGSPENLEIERLRAQHTEAKEVFIKLIALGDHAHYANNATTDIHYSIEARLSTQLLTSLHTMVGVSSRIVDQLAKIMETTMVEMLKIITSVFVAIFVLFAAGWVLITRRIALPVAALHNDIDTIAKGDLGHQVTGFHDDEIGSVAARINVMAKNLAETLVSRDALKVEVVQRKDAEASLRESEAGLTKAQRIAHLGNWEWDTRTNASLWSDEVYRIYGLEPQSLEITYEVFLDLVHADDREEVEQAVNTILSGKQPYAFNFRIIRADGEERTVHEKGELQFDVTGKPTRIIGTVQDITERILAEKELNVTLAALSQTNEELQQFIYSVSHDLRAPLRAINGFSEALREDYGDALKGDAQIFLGHLCDGAQEMGNLIDDLLKLSRITRGEIVMSETDLSAIADEVAEGLKKLETGRSGEFVIQPNVSAFADHRLMRVTLENLLGNAWKFTRHESDARIEFGAREENGKVVCYVNDNGVGFDMAYVDKLFTPFQRLNQKDAFEGTGIGLSTVRRVIAHHGGRTWAEGTVGEGATFYFELSRKGEGP